MENTETKMIIEIWELVKEFVPEKDFGPKKKKEFLFELFKRLEDFDIFVADLKDLKGEDRFIDAALADYVDDDEEDNDETDAYGDEW